MSDFIVGLTGGVASGKSEVTRRFQALGVEVVDADVAAREVVEPGQPALGRIAERFGAGMLLAASNRIAGVADEGGYWPTVETNEAVFALLIRLSVEYSW